MNDGPRRIPMHSAGVIPGFLCPAAVAASHFVIRALLYEDSDTRPRGSRENREQQDRYPQFQLVYERLLALPAAPETEIAGRSNQYPSRSSGLCDPVVAGAHGGRYHVYAVGFPCLQGGAATDRKLYLSKLSAGRRRYGSGLYQRVCRQRSKGTAVGIGAWWWWPFC